MRRVVALFLPTFPTDQIRRRNGGAPARELPMVTAIQESNRRVLASVDDAARKLKLAWQHSHGLRCGAHAFRRS